MEDRYRKARDPILRSHSQILGLISEGKSTTEVMEATGYSRGWIQRLARRYNADGVSALQERSRAPHSHPNAIPSDMVQSILAIRRRHPRWGPRKVRVVLKRQRPRATLPAASRIGDILKRFAAAVLGQVDLAIIG